MISTCLLHMLNLRLVPSVSCKYMRTFDCSFALGCLISYKALKEKHTSVVCGRWCMFNLYMTTSSEIRNSLGFFWYINKNSNNDWYLCTLEFSRTLTSNFSHIATKFLRSADKSLFCLCVLFCLLGRQSQQERGEKERSYLVVHSSAHKC